jgi:hypothetical protein
MFEWAITNLPEWNQIIWEYPERGQFSPNNMNSSWLSISYIEGNNPKTKSLSSNFEKLHKESENEKTIRVGNYTHNIITVENLKHLID